MDTLMQRPLGLCSTKAGLAVGTTTTLTTANTQLYSLKGKAYTAAAAANEATPTLDSNTGVAFVPVPVSKGCVFVICRDAAAALKAVQGSIVDLDGIAGSNLFMQSLPQFPPIPDTLCPIGYVVVKVGTTGAAWTFGASNFAGPPTGVVFAFQDCFTLPDRPQAA